MRKKINIKIKEKKIIAIEVAAAVMNKMVIIKIIIIIKITRNNYLKL